MVQGTNCYFFVVIWITMLALQIGNAGNMGLMSCLGGGIRSLSVLVLDTVLACTLMSMQHIAVRIGK